MIGVKIRKRKKMSINSVNSFINPEYIYIPFNKDDELLVKENDSVLKGSIIIKNMKHDYFIHSSVSGKVIGFEEKRIFNNKMSNTIKIKNDFKEKCCYDGEIDIDKYSKEEFINILKESGIIGLGGAGFPTYIKYNSPKKIKTLIINAVECEPYITADYMLAMSNMKEILKTIDAIMKICDIKECYIAVKSKNYKLNEKIITMSYKYKNIKISEMPNLYPMGWERALVRCIKHTDYNITPIEKGIVVNNISTIYSIFEALKYNKPLIERIITFSGDNMKKPCNVLVKSGTLLSDVLDYIGGMKADAKLILGGPMMGINVDDSNISLMPNTNSVLALSYTEIDPETCLRCGKCSDNCPAKLAPVLIKDYKDDPNRLKKMHPEKCIECGICSYICPSKINVREYVKEAKAKVKGDK